MKLQILRHNVKRWLIRYETRIMRAVALLTCLGVLILILKEMV